MLIGSQPEEAFLISAVIVVVSHLSAKTSVYTGKSPEMLDAVIQTELVRKETSVQMVGCTKCFELL